MTVGTQWQFIVCLGHWRDRIALKLFRKIIHQWNESSHERQSGVLTALAWLVPHETAAVSARSVYTIQPRHFMQNHIRKVHVFSYNLPPALSAEWPGSFTCYCGNTVVKHTKIRVSTEGWPWRRKWKFSRRSCRYSNSWPFNHESGAPTTELFHSQWQIHHTKMSLTRLLWRFIRILFALVTFFNRNNSTIQQR